MPSPTANALPRLPNELFDRIITFVIADSVHSICVSPGDTTWDMDVLPTLHQVSPLFRAISTEVVRKALDMPRVKQPVDPGEPEAVDEHSSSVSHSSINGYICRARNARVLQALRKAFDMPCAKRTVDPGEDALDEHSLSVPHSSINVYICQTSKRQSPPNPPQNPHIPTLHQHPTPAPNRMGPSDVPKHELSRRSVGARVCALSQLHDDKEELDTRERGDVQELACGDICGAATEYVFV